jgi:Protein of unknown function (DUF3738)
MSSCARSLYFGSGLMLVAAVGNAAAFCQTQQPVTRPEFDVASIRQHANGDNRAYVQASEGRLAMANFSLKQLILFAYNVPNNQVLGVQAWMDSNHFDIQATTESAPTVKQLEEPMLQALLEERFQLKVHREAMERPVYELTIEKGGVKMQLSKEGSCTPYSMDSPPPLPAPNAPRPGLQATGSTGHSTGRGAALKSWPLPYLDPGSTDLSSTGPDSLEDLIYI